MDNMGSTGLGASNAQRSPLVDIDWEAAWHSYQDGRSKPEDSKRWDKRASNFGEGSDGSYERRFVELVGAKPDETVLDMGCGTGLIGIALAQAGCHVVCADFSPKMLEETERNACKAGVRDRIEIRQLAWDDDWTACGLGHDTVDVAIASRSLATYHLTSALAKLDGAARRRVCVTLATGRSPTRDERAYDAVGRPRMVVADFIYALNILLAHSIYPELSYITTYKRPGFYDRQQAFDEMTNMVGGDLTKEEIAALNAFLDEHYAENPQASLRHRYQSDAVRAVRWAFISWGIDDGDSRQ